MAYVRGTCSSSNYLIGVMHLLPRVVASTATLATYVHFVMACIYQYAMRSLMAKRMSYLPPATADMISSKI